jgi:uncharacterized protein (DUF983 family)
MKKGTRLYSIFNNKCPRCHEGDFFIGKSAYNFRTFMKMHERCQVCGQPYDPEPGYYFGAMYVSYAVNVAVMVAVWIASMILFSNDLNIWWVVLATIIAGLILTPWTFRFSRLGWINFFVKYDRTLSAGK